MRTFLVLLLLCGVCSCNKPDTAQSKPTVLVSIPVYRYFVERIAGDTVKVCSLVPSGANPHLYEPTPKEVFQVSQANLFIRLGEPSEQKAYTVLQEQNPSMRMVNLSEGIALLSHEEGEEAFGKIHCCSHHGESKDLHIWLSPRLAKRQAEQIAAELIQLWPSHSQLYTEGLKTFIEDLDQLDRTISTVLADKKGSAILVSHPAFGYLCQDVGLHQISIEIEGKDPLPQDITQVLKKAKEYKITHIIAEPQYSDKGVKLIAERLGIPIVVIDPYAEDYLKNMKHLAQVLAE